METTSGWGFLNWFVVAVYLLATLALGLFFKARNKSGKDYFQGGGRVPAWVTALSIYATLLSSISYLAIPASIYKNGIVVALSAIGIAVFAVFVAQMVVPLYRRVNVVTSYQYLEKRFDSAFLKIVGSLSFSLFHVARIALVLYLPAVALMAIFPSASVELLIVITGVVCVGYSAVSGIEGIAWSDAFQAILLVIGGLVMIIVGLQYIPEQGLWAALTEQGKNLSAANFQFSLSDDSIWAVVIANGIFGSIYAYIGSQDVVQRYNITPTEKEAKRSILLNIPFLMVSTLNFVFIGAALIIFFNYSGHTLPENISGNSIVPYFIFHYLPVGLSGVVMVGILSATQSTVSSSINSLATCVANDLYIPSRQLSEEEKEVKRFKVGKLASWLFGILGTLLAYWLLQVGQGDVFKTFVRLTGLICGPISAVFLLAMFVPKASRLAGIVAFLVSVTVSLWIAGSLPLPKPEINSFLVSAIIIFSGFIVGFVMSLVAPETKKDLTNLTYFTIKKDNKDVA